MREGEYIYYTSIQTKEDESDKSSSNPSLNRLAKQNPNTNKSRNNRK
jgi:hypothetical protein